MSAELTLDDLDLEQLIDDAGELRLVEDDTGWSGYVHEDGAFYFVDTRLGRDRELRVGQRAVRLDVQDRAGHVLDLADRIRRAAP